MLVEAKELQLELQELALAANTPPEDLRVLGAKKRSSSSRNNLPPRTSPREARELCEQALKTDQQLKMLYVTRTRVRRLLQVLPERLALNPEGIQVLVAKDIKTNERLSYHIAQIERLQLV